MFRKPLVALVAALTMTVVMVPEANAWNLGSRSRLVPVETASAATTFQPLCIDFPSECRKSRRTITAYTAKVRALLVLASARVNDVMAPQVGLTRSCRGAFQVLSSNDLKQFV